MKVFIVLSAVIALAAARAVYQTQGGEYETQGGYQAQQQQYEYKQQKEQKIIPIVKFESEQTKNGYKFGYEGANGIQVIEQAQVKNEGQKDEATVAEGFYSYKGDDGKQYSVQYVADENGFRAVGDHLPTPVPLPAENIKLIEEVYARPTSKYDEEDYGYGEEEQQKKGQGQQKQYVYQQQKQQEQGQYYAQQQAQKQQYYEH